MSGGGTPRGAGHPSMHGCPGLDLVGSVEACPFPCPCSGLPAQVVCDNGNSDINARCAACDGATRGRDATCLFGCPTTSAPVSCADGQTETNTCFASCAGQTGCSPL